MSDVEVSLDVVVVTPAGHPLSMVCVISSSPGQPSLRSRAEPLGVSRLHPKAQPNVLSSNTELEVVWWLAEQALRCSCRCVAIVLIFPEDLACHALKGRDFTVGALGVPILSTWRPLQSLT